MPRTCKLCAHNKRISFDRYIAHGHSYKEFCKKFGIKITPFALSRHRKHIVESVGVEQSLTTNLDQTTIRKINGKLSALARRAERSGRVGPAISAYARLTQNLE